MQGNHKHLITEGILHEGVVKQFTESMSETCGQLLKTPATPTILASEDKGVLIFSTVHHHIH